MLENLPSASAEGIFPPPLFSLLLPLQEACHPTLLKEARFLARVQTYVSLLLPVLSLICHWKPVSSDALPPIAFPHS